MIDGVDALAVVQAQQGEAVDLLDFDVVVLRLAFENLTGQILDVEIAEEQEARQDERPQPEERDFPPAFFHPQAAERDQQDEQAEEQDGAAGADQREEQQGGQEGAQHRADRGECVQVAGDVAGLLVHL